MALESFGAGRKDIGGGKFDKFTGEQGKKYRIGILTHDFSAPFKGAPTHYNKTAKSGYLCKSTKEKPEICCTHDYPGNDPKYKILAAIVVYQINDSNQIVGVDIKPWVFNEQMYKKLEALSEDTPWGEWDIELECTDKSFQSFNATPKKNSIWQGKPELKEKCLAAHDKIMKQAKNFLPRDLSVAEIREVLGIAGGAASAADLDLSDLTNA